MLTWNGPKVVARLRAASAQRVKDVAERVLAEAQSNVPVDTGELKASGHVVEDPADPAVAYVIYDAMHSAYVHDGTSRMLARPWLAQAVLAETTDALETFQAIARA